MKNRERQEQLAKNSAIAVVVLGDDERIVGESKSRTSLDLPGYQLDLVKAIYETGTPIVVVLLNGRPMTINWINKYVPAVVEAWFPGKWGGDAVADVLFGDYNPGGKLPVTFPKTIGQLPLDFPHKPGSHSGDVSSVDGVLYPFGHGLSYTEFSYSNLVITPAEQKKDANITVTLEVKNTGTRKGDEVVQLYTRQVTSSVTTFVKNLKGFKRISFEPGEVKTVSFELSPEDLSIISRENKFTVEPGKFNVMIGSSSEDIRLNGSFIIKD